MQLNFNCIHSHPQFRDSLEVIKRVVGMLVECNKVKKQLFERVKQVPYIQVSEHLLSITHIFSRKLHQRLYDYTFVPLLERLLTDYLRNIMSYNQLGGELARPVAVQFGFPELEGHIVCASDQHRSKFWKQQRPDQDTFEQLFKEWFRLYQFYYSLVEALGQSKRFYQQERRGENIIHVEMESTQLRYDFMGTIRLQSKR